MRAVLGGLHRSETHRQVLDEGGVDVVQAEAHGVLVDFVDALDRFVQVHIGEVRGLGGIGFAERILRVEQALEGEQHVVGVEVAGRGEIVGGVEFHAVAQVEGVGEAVF
ncbi:hypothetical protein D3C84_616370 [compost metagenome]